MWAYLDSLTRSLRDLDNEHWMLLFVGVVIFGVICMKGFGSRSNY